MKMPSLPDNLITKYLNGNLVDDECEILNNWLKEDKKNADYFRKYCKDHVIVSDNYLDESWKILLSKRDLRFTASEIFKVMEQPTYKKLYISFLRYAAVFIIGILATMLVSYQINQHNEIPSHWVTTETVAGQKAKVILPDNSIVWLNSETSLSFSSDFLNQKNRIVNIEGEAYFEVQPQDKKNFIVRSNDYDINVKGTKFNVMAYKDFNRTETTLVEGSVVITRGEVNLMLKPGERVIGTIDNITKSKGQLRQATLWTENKFYFDNVPFKELVRRLERWYDVKIILLDTSLQDIYYSGYFKNEETIWQVLDVIRMTTPIEYDRKEFREITITKASQL